VGLRLTEEVRAGKERPQGDGGEVMGYRGGGNGVMSCISTPENTQQRNRQRLIRTKALGSKHTPNHHRISSRYRMNGVQIRITCSQDYTNNEPQILKNSPKEPKT